MIRRDELTGWLNYYLKLDEISENFWNGLQVEGKEDVNKIAFAVDAGIETFQKAAESQADFLITHHGQFSKSWNPSLVGPSKKRIKILMDSNISLYCAHLPLDRHLEVGNNAQILYLLGAKIIGEFDMHEGKNIGWIGELPYTATADQIAGVLKEKLKAECKILSFGKDKIKTIAVCSGGGGYSVFAEAVSSKADLYITGDSVEVYHSSKDAGMNVIFAGHYATESQGIKALADIIKNQFEIEVVFIDVPTGL
jgi:dinuclear metal center YbgI/SA1388 family protein